jgi:thymidylate kinase
MKELREPPNGKGAICLIGMDGTGKTTHSRALIDRLHKLGIKCKYVWFGKASFFSYPFMMVCRMLSLTTTHHIENGITVSEHKYYRNRLISRVWPWVQFLDVLVSVKRARIKLLLWRGFTVVCDRSIPDMLVELMVDVNDNDLHKKLVGQLMLRLMPRPLILISLDVNERTAWRRKDDVPEIECLSRRRNVYRLISRDLGIPTVDAEESIVSVQRRVITLVDGLDRKSIAQQHQARANYAP